MRENGTLPHGRQAATETLKLQKPYRAEQESSSSEINTRRSKIAAFTQEDF
jgi:hypothetical protein